MPSDYTFLTDHSYSLRIDQEKLSLKQQRDMKRKKTRRTTNIRLNFFQKKTDRNSSDKENNSSVSLINRRNQRKNLTKKKSSVVKMSEGLPSLSIEERVKLRRTKPFTSAIPPIKRRVKSKKFFLGSGLDLDNIVLGNRRRRSVQT